MQKEAINRTLAAEAVIYAIGIGSKRDGVDRDVLRELSQRTGGRAFFPDKKIDLNAGVCGDRARAANAVSDRLFINEQEARWCLSKDND